MEDSGFSVSGSMARKLRLRGRFRVDGALESRYIELQRPPNPGKPCKGGKFSLHRRVEEFFQEERGMKRVLGGFLGLTLCLGLANAAALAAPARASQATAPVRQAPYTVAEFAADLAAAMGVPSQSSDSAVGTLRGRGIRIGNPSAPLTEGDLVNLLTQAGISVTTSQPEKSVNKSRGREVLAAFGAQLSAKGGGLNTSPCVGCNNGTGSTPNDDFNNGNGRGGKFKRKKKNSQNGSD